MDRHAFRQLVTQLELEHHLHPERFLADTRVLVWTGYLVLAGSVVLGALACVALAIAAVLLGGVGLGFLAVAAITAAGVSLSVLRALFVRMGAPEGYELKREEAPALFAEIDGMARALECRPVHKVLLTDEMNAAMSQVARFGIFGGYRNILIIGVPLLYALPWEQFRSVIAHELGHLAHGHGSQGSLAYRQRITWMRLVERLQRRDSFIDMPLVAFLRWFWPRLDARLFVLSRGAEREADAAAARIASPGIASEALMTINGVGRRVESRLRESWKRAFLENERAIPLEYEAPVRARVDDEWVAIDLLRNLRSATDMVDTHPSLSERLSSIGDPEVIAALRLKDNCTHATEDDVKALALQMEEHRVAQESAAHHYFPQGPDGALERFRRAEQEQLSVKWAGQRAPLVELAKRRGELEAKEASGTASVDERLELAGALLVLEGEAAAFRAIERLLAAEPENEDALYGGGMMLLDQRRDERGIAMIEKAIRANPLRARRGIGAIATFLDSEGRQAEIERFLALGDRCDEEIERAEAERNGLRQGDTLLHHGLAPAKLAACVPAFAGQKRVKRAWLFRKGVRHIPSMPYYIVVIEMGLLNHRESVMQKVAGALIEQLSPHLDHFGVVIIGSFENRWLAELVETRPEALVHARGK